MVGGIFRGGSLMIEFMGKNLNFILGTPKAIGLNQKNDRSRRNLGWSELEV